jgi:hypothetical protein
LILYLARYNFEKIQRYISKIPSCRHCEFLFPKNKQKKPTKTSDRRSITLARRSGTLRRAEIFDGPVVRALRATPNQINRSFPSGVARNARTRIGNHPVVIARRNDEAIRLLSDISGLLHFVRNDESGLSRQPLLRENDLFFYRHSVPNGTIRQSCCRHW